MPSRKFPKHTLITALIMLFIAVVITYKNVEGFQTTQSYHILSRLNDVNTSIYGAVIADSTNVYNILSKTPFGFNAQYDTATQIDLSKFPETSTASPAVPPARVTYPINTYKDIFKNSPLYNNILDSRFIGSSVQVPKVAYWFEPESDTNYKFSQDIKLLNDKYIASIGGVSHSIRFYDLNNQPIPTTLLRTTVSKGLGHMKLVSPEDSGSGNWEWRYSVQLNTNQWVYVKLKIEQYVVPPASPLNGGSGQGTSPPAGSSEPSDSPNYLLIGTGIAVGVVFLSFLFRK